MDGEENSIWSFGSKKNTKKKTTTSGFDFGLGSLDEDKVDETAKPAESDEWGVFGAVGG